MPGGDQAVSQPLASVSKDRLSRSGPSPLDSRHAFLFMIAGSVLFLLVFVGYPIFYNLVMSFQEVRLGNIRDFSRPFIGFSNYTDLLEDPLFLQVASNTAVFVAASVLLQTGCGLALAMFFNLGFPGARWMRGIVLSGWILPPLVIAAIFHWLFSSNAGIVNELLLMTGLTQRSIGFLTGPETAMLVAVLTNVWIGAPFAMILLAAALSELPRELYEAAGLDGASAGQRFRHITWPLMRPTIFAVLILCTIYALRTFDVIWGLTSGGPVNATTTFPIWAYQQSFQTFHFGHGAAISAIMFAVVVVLAVLYNRSLRAEVQQ